MDFLEKDLEDIIWENLGKENVRKLYDKGLDLFSIINEINSSQDIIESPLMKYRQLKIGNYGIADIVLVEKNYDYGFKGEIVPGIDIYIIELKKGKIDLNAIKQTYRYKIGIERYLRQRGIKLHNIKIYPVVIGKKINEDHDWVYMAESLDNLRVFSYNYAIDGLSFEEETFYYHLIDEGF